MPNSRVFSELHSYIKALCRMMMNKFINHTDQTPKGKINLNLNQTYIYSDCTPKAQTLVIFTIKVNKHYFSTAHAIILYSKAISK